MLKRFIVIFVFIGFFQYSFSQERDCGASLDEAKKEFEAGHLENISNILMDCLDKGFSDNEKIDAYRLLTITYLYLDNQYEAKESFKKLLNIDYEYKILPTDPIEMEYLSREYITTPIISFSAKIGANLSTVTMLHRNTTGNENDNYWNYKPSVGANFIGGLDLHFSKSLSLNVELDFNYHRVVYTDVLFPAFATYDAEPHEIESKLSTFFGSTPITLKYTFAKDFSGAKQGVKRLYYPYIYAGYAPAYTLYSVSDDKRDPVNGGKIEGPVVNLKGKTPAFTHSLIFGVGMKRRIKYRYILVDFRYRYGMSDMLDVKNQYDFSDEAIKDRLFTYGINSDNYRMSSFEITVGYIWPKYKVRRKNSVTIQTFFGNMFGKKDKNDE